jgi:hypothetical protein
MRFSAQCLLHHQGLSEWTTSRLEEKMSLTLVFDVFLVKIVSCAECFKRMMSPRLMLLSVCSAMSANS